MASQRTANARNSKGATHRWRKGAAMCPACRKWIVKGEMVKAAPGRGVVWKHVSCGTGGN